MPPEEKQSQKVPFIEQLLFPQRWGNVFSSTFSEIKSAVQNWVNALKELQAGQIPSTPISTVPEKKVEESGILKPSVISSSLKQMKVPSFATTVSTPAVEKLKEDIKEPSSTEQIRLPTEQPEEFRKKREEMQKNIIFSFVGGNPNSLGANYTYQTLKMWEELGGEIEPQHLYAYLSRMFELGLQFYTRLGAIGGLPPNVYPQDVTYYAVGEWLDNIYTPHVKEAFNLKLPDLSNLNLLYQQAKIKYESNPTEDNYRNYVSLHYTKEYFEKIYRAFKIMKKPAPAWLEKAIGAKSMAKSREEEVIDFMEDFLRSYETQQEQIQRYFEQPPQIYKLK
ncbi:MAG: hypothetical protein QW367_03710 [Candidatus Aenigmatarchaeota archaeon]